MDRLTIQKEIFFRGLGIHSGKAVDLALKPSDSGEIVFKRTDLDGLEVKLDPRAARSRNCSYLEARDCRIDTVEHLLATLSIFGVDSLSVELNGGEIPILDGSALPFAEALARSGTRPAGPGKKVMKILKPFAVEEGGASLEAMLSEKLRITYRIDFDHPAIGKQEADIKPNPEVFLKEIAPARTFGFLKDLPELRRRGLAGGGSFQNTLVLDGEKVVNGPLRFPDEFVRHKILDLIGDLYILGCPIIGWFKASKAGHGLHLRAVNFLLDHPDSWEYQE